jgi:class 3 adenylate cyclase
VAIGAHRKVVTVLFCDVVGSTALGESVDPETAQAPR